MKPFLVVCLVIFSLSSSAFAVNEVSNREAIRKQLGLSGFTAGESLTNLKIAVLDNGFQGFVPGKGLLPDSAELIEGPKNPQAATAHGLGMAQIVWAATGSLPEGPQFYLVNANGFSNFKAAVDFIIEKQIDIVVYSQVWPFGTNFDGTGFINAEVNRATTAGVIWINAAGNDGGQAYNSRVNELLNSDRDGLRFENKMDENPIMITLSWSDFKDTETYNTNKDLDLFVYDSEGNLVASSELIQSGVAPETGVPSKLSSHARESITLPALDRGKYTIRVRAKSTNFEEDDRLRVLISADKGQIIFKDRTPGGEVMAPADNTTVITVGDTSEVSSKGPTSDGRRKPDILVSDSRVTFTNGKNTAGTSNAAAMVAGAVAVLKSRAPTLTSAGLSRYLANIRGTSSNTTDLKPVRPVFIPASLRQKIPAGATVMQKANGLIVVVTPMDPFELPWFKIPGVSRTNEDDVIILSPSENRWYVISMEDEASVAPPYIEYRQGKMSGAKLWKMPSAAELSRF